MAFAWKFLLPISIINIFISGIAWHLRQQGAAVTAGVWGVSLGMLYVTAVGLNKLNRANVKPREYKYAE